MSHLAPAEVFPPGEFLKDELDARGWSQTEFAEIIKRPTRLVNEILAAKRGITPDTARELAAALGTSPQFWMNLETSYQLSKAKAPTEDITRSAKLRERFPVREMAKRGWIEVSDNLTVLETNILNFFGISSLDAEIHQAHAAKRNHDDPLSMLQTAWVLRVQQLASAMPVAKYSETKLRNALALLEQLMVDAEEIRKVPHLLAEAGVRIVIVEPIPGSKIDGVCLWINGKQSPVIGLSLRLDRIDNFWFVLRHEIEHVLRGDGKERWIIDELDDASQSESEAEIASNNAAAEYCVSQKALNDFVARLHPLYSDLNLKGFANLAKRHPGIVAGQLRRKLNRYDLFSKYLIKVRHIIIESALTDGYGRQPISL